VTFLAPIPAIIAAALTVPVLLAYYLLKLRRRPVRVSSTLLWMQAVRDVQVNVPFRWLRPTWLLFLQLAVLALLLTAMARPAVDAAGSTPGRIILLIDRSASMSAVDEPGGLARLQRAQQEALRMIDELSRSAGPISAAVIAVAAEPVALTAFTSDRGRLRSAVGSITPTDQPGEGGIAGTGTGRGLQAAFDLAGAMLAGDVEELGPRESGLVILFTDGVSAEREAYSLTGDFRYVHIGEASGAANLGIAAISARRDWDEPSQVRIFARVVNAGEEAVAAPLAVLVDGQEVQRSAIEVPGMEMAAEGETPQRGEAAATFRLDLRDGGVVTVRLLHDDALDRDNEASVVVDPARRPRVLLVIPDRAPLPEGQEETGARRGPEWFITEVVRELRLPLRVVPAAAYERDAASGAALPADLVIFDRVMPQRVPPIPSMSFGASLPLEVLHVEEGAAGERGLHVLWWQRTHPILRHVSLDTLSVARALRFRVDRAAAENARIQVHELARSAHGPLILLVDDQRAARLLVAFELMQSNWPMQWSFPIFMAAAVDHLTLHGEAGAGRAFTTAEPASIRVPAGQSRVVLEGPRRIVLDLPPQSASADGMRQVNLGRLERAGVYRLAGTDDGPAGAIAVNLANETESALLGRQAIRVGGETHAARAGTSGPREIWHWFILAALGLLCVEWLVNARGMRI
jgi:hypothetical protein